MTQNASVSPSTNDSKGPSEIQDNFLSLSAWRHFIPLTKPTISLLVVVTVVPALLAAAEGLPTLSVAITALIGTYLASASASVFNHLLDADVDEQMNRTRGRPVPSGKVNQTGALIFGIILGAASLAILCAWTTPLAAVIALLANAFYVLVYTWFLKRRTDQNIVIGGAAGAVGPLIGWAAVSNSIAWPAWVLFAIIFLWTPPHFWALALKYQKDYAAARIPMLPVTRGEETTRRHIFLYTLTLIPPVTALYAYGSFGLLYFIPSLAATLWFVWMGFKLWRDHSNAHAMPLFHYSCLYLFIIFGCLTLDLLVALT